MAREVSHEEELAEQGGTAVVCQCGLSDNKPYCDRSHSATTGGEDGALYKYEDDDDEKGRHVVSD